MLIASATKIDPDLEKSKESDEPLILVPPISRDQPIPTLPQGKRLGGSFSDHLTVWISKAKRHQRVSP